MKNILIQTISNFARPNMRRVLLLSGFLSAIIYVVADIVASLSYPGYSITGQNYSELLATGAPTRQGLLLISWVYNFLVACFGVAIWKTCQPAYKARITGAVILGYAIISMITPLYFQMDMRGAEPTPYGSLHPLMTGIMSFFIILSIGSGAFLSGKGFRIYSFVTIAVVIAFGLLTVDQVPDLEAGLDTPWMGLKERINIYLTMIWFAMLSLNIYYIFISVDLTRDH
jgi:magnesium-transporting ATPase (P-type)